MVTYLKSSRRSRSPWRRGSAVVELAIMLPLLFLLIAGILEVCEGFFLRQKITLAAHEGARVAIRRSATDESVETAVGRYLDARGVHTESLGSAISIQPPLNQVNELEPLTVSVTVPIDSNTRMPTSFYQFLDGSTVTAQVTMFKEFSNTD